VNLLLQRLQQYWHPSWKSVRAPCRITGKNMKTPVGRYVSWKPQCSEMSSWYGGIEERREGLG
jgi:hypothetical protein